ncbi:uncharacterized protein A4U43_C01F20170 [Asparagus officinalis]|uniref:Isopenicillin N synthase-like Fe(2+) 2OG dioxygenase domain-containing protein n=1 Tax=Asparagus officinalis TaxID=4686 RepID=A0A5P1FR13_ASPOF|nr:uncharacterized protein A4U43_C01F20170 [Asparagus officinalis]
MITGDDKWAEIRALVWAAVEIHGCFEAEYDKVTPKLRDALFGKCMKELFELPSEIKMKNTSNKPYHGYIGNIPCRAYESLNVDNANESEGVEEFSALMWGDKGNPSFCNTIFTFSKHIAELEQMVRRMILESLGMAKYYDECIKSTAYGLRLSEYGIGSTNNIGMQSHRDSIILAMVCQHGVEGLEVQAKDGRWLTPSLNSLTVIIGEAFWVCVLVTYYQL